MLPLVGFNKPINISKQVVFPDPVAPFKKTLLPFLISNFFDLIISGPLSLY